MALPPFGRDHGICLVLNAHMRRRLRPWFWPCAASTVNAVSNDLCALRKGNILPWRLADAMHRLPLPVHVNATGRHTH